LCPLSWWKQNETTYLTLLKVVKDIFGIIATSAKRLFSKASLVIRKQE